MKNLVFALLSIIVLNANSCLTPPEPPEPAILNVMVTNESGGDVVIRTYVDLNNEIQEIQIDSASTFETGFTSYQLYGEAMLVLLQSGFSEFHAESDSNYFSVLFNDTLKIDHYKIPRTADFEGDSSKIFLGESRNLFTEDSYEIEERNYNGYDATYTFTVADYEYALEAYE